MNKISRFFLAAALALSLFAPASASSSAGDDVIRGPYEPTRFGDNTFIDVQGGVNAFGASNMTRGDVWSSVRPSAALGVSLGKWFVPSVGLRVGWQIMSGKTRIPSDDRRFLGYEPTVVEAGGGILKYVIGVSASPSGAYENKVEIRKKYPDAFLVRISNGVSPYYYKPGKGR